MSSTPMNSTVLIMSVSTKHFLAPLTSVYTRERLLSRRGQGKKAGRARPPSIPVAANRTAPRQRAPTQLEQPRRGSRSNSNSNRNRNGAERQGTSTHNEMFFIQGGHRAARADLLVHERLRERRLVELVVTPETWSAMTRTGCLEICICSPAAIDDEVDDNVLAEVVTVLERHIDGPLNICVAP